MAEPAIRLFWITEQFTNWDCRVALRDLHSSVQPHVAALLRPEDNDVTLHLQLPFLDRRELRRRRETFSRFGLRRIGDAILPVTLPFSTALATAIAATIHTRPAWSSLSDRGGRRGPEVCRVSTSIQKHMRTWLTARVFFQDVNFFDDRKNAWPVIVYAASRPCNGLTQKDCVWDVRDGKMPYLERIDARLKAVLGKVEKLLRLTGRDQLAGKYDPKFSEDIRRAVIDRPGPLLHILARENRVIESMIALTDPHQRLERILPIAKTIERALRRVHGRDARPVALIALRAATEALSRTETPDLEDFDLIASPDGPPLGTELREEAPPIFSKGEEICQELQSGR